MRWFALLVCAMLTSLGCGVSVSWTVLSASLVREDGSKINVEAVGYVAGSGISIGQKSISSPYKSWVEVRTKGLMLVITETDISVGEKKLCDLPEGVKHVRVEIYRDGVKITADGGELLIDTRTSDDDD